MATKKPSTKKDVWKQDFASTHKIKGGTAVEKRAKYVYSQGGNDWDVKGFDRYMDYRTARQEQYKPGYTQATQSWQQSYDNNQAKLQAKWEKEAEEKRKKREAEAKKKQEQEKYSHKTTKKNSLLDDLLHMLPLVTKQAITKKPNVTDALNLAKDYVKSGESLNPATKEIARGITRTANTAAFGLPKEMAAKKQDPYYINQVFNERKGGGKAADFVYDALGYLAPAGKAYSALNASKVGKALTNFGSQSIGKRLLSEAGKGAVIGNVLADVEVGAREAINPADYNWKDNAGHIAFGTGTGAVADPAFYGIGKGFNKGMETASNKAMKSLLQDKDGAAERLSQLIKEYHQEQAPLPGKPDVRKASELIPSGNDITNPSFVSKLSPSDTQVVAPKIGEPVDLTTNIKLNEYALLGGKKTNLKTRAEYELKKTDSKLNETQPITKEFEQAVQKQYEYLKNSMGKGVQQGGLVRDKEGYVINVYGRVSNNPKWYQDFFRVNGRKPNNSELRELAVKHVKEGFQDEIGDIPAWQPKQVQEIDNQIEELVSTIQENPEQEAVLQPILDGLQEDRAALIQKTEAALNEHPILKQQKEELLKTLGQESPKTTTLKSKKNVIERKISEENQPTDDKLVQLLSDNQEVPKQATKTKELPKEGKPVIQQEIPLERPENLPYVRGERKHYSTLANSDKAPNEFIDGIKNLDRKITHSLSDKEATDFANGLINRDVEEAFQFVKNAAVRDKRHNVVGARLIDEFNKSGQFERSVDIADILAKEGTKAGQTLQSFSVYNRLSVEGHLIRAARTVAKTNATLPAGKQIVLTSEIAHDIAATADSIQKLTGQQEIGKNVISMLEQAKKGNRLTDEEMKAVQSFMADAKKYIGDLDPNAKPQKVKPINNARTRDKVVDFMSKQEMEAKKRIEARRNRANSLPVDIFYDYSVIGASKLAQGAVKFADFSEQMVKDLGEEVKPYLKQVYNEAVKTLNITTDKITPQRLTEAEKVVNKALKEKSLSPAQADELLGLTKKLVNAAGDSKFDASMDLQVVLNRLEQPSFAQMIESTRYQAMLLNPLTMIRNILGNEMFYRIDRVSKLVTVPLDAITTKMTGNQRTIVFNTGQFNWKNFLNPTKDYGKGFKIGAKAGWKGVNPLGINTAYDIKSPAFNSDAPNLGFIKKALTSRVNPLHWSEKALGVTMRSFDTAGYMRAYNQTLREQATLKAMNEGLKGKALREAADQYFREADENMMAIAQEYGKYATFQDNTSLARGMTVLKEKLNEVSTYAVTGGLGKSKETGLGSVIIPFPKTPANLVMRAIDYSPAGVLRSVNLMKNYLKLGKNPLDVREAQLAFGRSLVGTGGFSMFGFILANKGVLTSAGDSDYEVRELEKMAGKQPNSVNISAVKRFVSNGYNLKDLDMKTGDKFVSYDWAQPLSIAIALGTGVSQAYKENEDPTATSKILGAADSAANTIINMSSLAGLNKLISGPPNEGWSEKIAGSVSSVGSSFVPTILNQVRKKDDNQTRSTYGPNFKDQFNNAILNRIPKVEKKLPPTYNTLGEKKELYQNDSNSILNIFANPSFNSKYKPSPEAKLLLDYMNKTGDKTLVPHIPDKKLDGVPLTGKQYAELQRIMGTEVKKGVKDLLPFVKQSPDDTEALGDKLKDILKDAGKKARAEVRSKMVSKKQLDEAYKKYGLSESTIYERIEKGKTLKWALTTPE
jgi:Mor family transcriptional regulator